LSNYTAFAINKCNKGLGKISLLKCT